MLPVTLPSFVFKLRTDACYPHLAEATRREVGHLQITLLNIGTKGPSHPRHQWMTELAVPRPSAAANSQAVYQISGTGLSVFDLLQLLLADPKYAWLHSETKSMLSTMVGTIREAINAGPISSIAPWLECYNDDGTMSGVTRELDKALTGMSIESREQLLEQFPSLGKCLESFDRVKAQAVVSETTGQG